jgi:hypothetical protein
MITLLRLDKIIQQLIQFCIMDLICKCEEIGPINQPLEHVKHLLKPALKIVSTLPSYQNKARLT